MLTDLPILQAPPLAPRGKKPIMGSLNLPHLVSHKPPRDEDGHDAVAVSAPTTLRAGAPSSRDKGAEVPALSQRSGGR